MHYDLIVIGSGAAGMIAAITAARQSKSVLLLEKLSKLGAKLKATGGGRCNLTNTLSNEEFMSRFGREGRFMSSALEDFDHKSLMEFFDKLGVQTHIPDGFRVFPTTHDATTILNALIQELENLGVTIKTNQRARELIIEDTQGYEVRTQDAQYRTKNLIIATGGLGYPVLGAEGDGHEMLGALGHRITELHPAMMPLRTKERWIGNCRADTIAKAELRVDMKKHKKLKAAGDLIFTKTGIRGPVVLDFSREITPLLHKYEEVPLLANFVKGKNEEEIRTALKTAQIKNPESNTLSLLTTLLPSALAQELCTLVGVDSSKMLKELEGAKRAELIKIINATPLTINGHDGFKLAMITRGGVSLKEIEPRTMESKKFKGLYMCGEVMNLDGPCGGYNLQWSFASGYLAGQLLGQT